MKTLASILVCISVLSTTPVLAQWAGTNPVTFIPTGDGGKADGATITDGVLISCNDSGTSLNLGVDAAGPQYSWLQSRSRASSLMMNLALNPWGGKVGIGTASVPSTKLEVNGSISMVRGNRLQFLETVGGANRAFIEGDVSNQLLFHVGSGAGTDAMMIDYAANVGIGNSVPAAKLDVGGQIKGITQIHLGVNYDPTNGRGITVDNGVSTAWELINLRNNSGTHFRIAGNGKVAIGSGTTDPDMKLAVYSSDQFISRFHSTGTATISGIRLGRTSAYTDLVNLSNGFGIGAGTTSANLPLNSQDLSHVDFFIDNSTGNVGIGTTSPGSFKLAVNGKIWTQEVNVQMTNPGPDYVFEPEYDLLSLSEVETYIKANKHLPEVPSAKEMDANGLNLKEMNLLLLKKVEELTLHLIEQSKEIRELKAGLNEIKNKN